jgi:hypothetical protein
MSPYYHKDYKTNILSTLAFPVNLLVGFRYAEIHLLLVAQSIGNSSLGQVVGREFDLDSIAR